MLQHDIPIRSFRRHRHTACALGVMLVAGFGSTIVNAADVVVLIDGKRHEGTVESIDKEGVVSGSGLASGIRLDEVREIARDVKPNPAAEHILLHLFGGGQIIAEQVTLEDEKCVVTLKSGKKLDLPMSAVAGVRTLPDPKAIAALQNNDSLRAAVADPGTRDILFIVTKGKVAPVPGFFERLTDKEIEFTYKDKKRTVERSRIFGFMLAQVKDAPDLAGHVKVSLTDGSQIWCRVDGFKDGNLAAKLPVGGEVALPWNDVVRLDVRNDRLVFLSDLTPKAIQEQPIVAFPRRWQTNRNVLGQVLQLGERQFTNGIGVQPRTSLTYERPEGFDSLAATIGIDAVAKGRGDCEFVVLAGDKELVRKRVRGGEEPVELRVTIADHAELTLRVEAGADLDLSDYANWCDVRFIKSNKE